MKILLYNDIFGPCGGAESHIQVLRQELRGLGHELEFCAFAERLPSRFGWRQKLAFVHRAQISQSVLRSKWKAKLDEFQPDLVHCHNNRLYTASIMQELAERDIAVISSFHDYDLLDFLHRPRSLKAKIKKRQFELIRRYSTLLTAPTARLCKQLKALHPSVAYLPYFIQNEDWSHPNGKNMGDKHLLYVGRMIRPKGIFRLVEALEELPEYRLTCVGDGVGMEDFRAAVKAKGLADRVSILGFLAPEPLKKAFREATCLVLPSQYEEVFGIVGIEAQAMGLPCIASEVGGINEWCQDHETGLLVAPSDAAGLRQTIRKLHTNPRLYQRLKKKGLQHQKQFFSAEAIMPQVEQLYQAAFTKRAEYPTYAKSQKQHSPSQHDYMPVGNYPIGSRLDDLHPHSISLDGCYTS